MILWDDVSTWRPVTSAAVRPMWAPLLPATTACSRCSALSAVARFAVLHSMALAASSLTTLGGFSFFLPLSFSSASAQGAN